MKTSESTKSIFKALTEFKKELKQPEKDTVNPFFKSKYVDLDGVVHALDEVLPSYKLNYIQNVTTDGSNRVGIQTIIIHESGESIEFDWLFIKPEKQTAQGIGSAITYGRRYTLTSAFGIASEPDDDGNEASGGKSKKNNRQSKPKPPKKISNAQVKTLKRVIETIADLVKQTPEQATNVLLNASGVADSLENINESQFGEFLNYLNTQRNNYQKKAKESKKEPTEKNEQTSLMDGNTTTAKGEK